MVIRSKKLYTLVLKLLQENPVYRDEDKKLMWKVWEIDGRMWQGNMTPGNFFSSSTTTPESITRCRRMIQKLNPSLRASSGVQRFRKIKQATKGTYMFREVIDPVTKEVRYRKEEVYGNLP